MKKLGFDNELYMRRQTEEIQKRMQSFSKLYMEFGGKLFDDYHAARVLPGFDVNAKIKLLQNFRDQAEVIFCINAGDIAKAKIRADFGITYERDLLRTIDIFRDLGLLVNGVVITQYIDLPAVETFRKLLERGGIRTYIHHTIHGYPSDIDHVVSEEGFGRNDYVETTRPLVVVTAPGASSGKLATCLSQLYHENRRGISAGYAKFETFPIWNLPLKHPVNLAYEAATADLNDVNMIDPYHLDYYGVTTVNYNRDVEAFPVLNAVFEKISGKSPYHSPTDMGVNMAGYAMVDDAVCRKASCDEIIRRYYAAKCDLRRDRGTETAVEKIEMLMRQLGIGVGDRPVVAGALARAEETEAPAVAIELPDGRIVTGRTSELLGPSAAALLNALKGLCEMSRETLLIARSVIEPIQELKVGSLGNHNPRLHSDEVLIALAISAGLGEEAAQAVAKLGELRGCQAHSTVILPQVDADIYRKLGIHLTCEPVYPTKKLYHK